MKILQSKEANYKEEKMRQYDDDRGRWKLTDGVEKGFIPFRLMKENNRGWTFDNYTITHHKTTLFFSRGEFEIIEIE